MSTNAAVREVSAPPSFLATRQGKLTLAFLCMVGFLDFVDASIVNVALPTIRHDLHFSVQSLQWVLSGYLLTYGGFMLLGGRAADLLGRRRVLAACIVNEQLHANPLAPLSIFRINGLGAANATQVVAIGAFYAMFFLLTLYMQNVLGYSQLQAGSAYLPATVGVAVSSGVASQLFARIGTRTIIVTGALISAGAIYWLSRIPVHGSYLENLLPGLVIMSFGLGFVFVGVNTAANAGVPPDKAGLAAALVNTSTWVGGAFGLAIFSVIATSRTHHLLAAGATQPDALTSGFHRALTACSIFLIAAAAIALRATNTRGEPVAGPALEAVPATDTA